MENKEIGKYLIIIAGIIGLIEAIVGFFVSSWFGWIGSILGLVISLLILLSCFRPGNPIPYTPIIELVLVILLLIFGSWIGGIIGIIGAVLLFLD